MSTHLFKNIHGLAGVREKNQLLTQADLAALPVINNAWVLVEGEEIAGYGEMDNLPANLRSHEHSTDATGGFLLPAWCDSHTHLVFSGSREQEFVDKIKGMTYAEIAARGGGILHSARMVNEASEDQLFNDAWKRLEEV